MTNRGLHLSIVVTIMVILATAGWSIWGGSLRPRAELTAITMGITDAEYSALPVIAEDQGYFRDLGLAVKFSELETGYSALTRLARGELDFAASTDFAFGIKSLQATNLRIVASIAMTTVHEVIARKDRGIEAPLDLRGKRIGVTLNTSGEYYLMMFLTINGIDLSEITVIDLPPQEVVESISDGAIDAAVGWDMSIYEITRRLKENVISWPAQGSQLVYWVLVTRQELIDRHPEAIAHLLEGMVQAEGYVHSEPNESKEILLKRWKREKDYFDYIWARMRLGVSLDQPLITTLESETRWKLKQHHNYDGALPNYLNYIYLDGLDSVKPQAITIFR